MHQTRKILIAVDGGRASWAALRFYVEYLWKRGDNVIVVHCIPQPFLPDVGANGDDVYRYLRSEKKKSVALEQDIVKFLRENGVIHRTVFSFGKSAGQFIVQTARRERPHVVITGTRGGGFFRRVFLGSVSRYVNRHCPFPVSVVKCKGDRFSSVTSVGDL